MAEPTSAEKRLLLLVNDTSLKTSLALIRVAAEAIWSADAPRVIHDFTDHGPSHSARLAKRATELLRANTSPKLTSEEAYLLLAGISLHDIGMQCHVVGHSEVKARAEELGAEFEIAFTAESASTYPADEQKAIRSNHQYLAAAWIDCAREHEADTKLGVAARSIPDELVGDVMDVCMFHSTLPIGECAETLEIGQTGRKQLVAALVRFADELDVDAQRVSIDTVKTFRLGPASAVYWWMHQQTKVTFPATNVVLLTVRLHPEDFEPLQQPVYDAFIGRFKRKNEPVLTVLARCSVPINISDESRVIPHRYTKPLPEEIVEALRAMARQPPLARLHQLPPDLADFAGRQKETGKLVATLREAKRGVAMCSVIGMGGIGKTALAVHAAHELTNEYPDCFPDAQIVVDLRGTSDRPLTTAQTMAQVIHAFHPEARIPADEGELAGLYRSTLAGRRALLLFDDARDTAQLRPLLPPEPCGVLVTSRKRLSLPGLRRVDLAELSQADAVALLREILGEGRESEGELAEIATLCGRLPLALRVAGSFLDTHPDWQVAAYVCTLRDERERLARLRYEDLDVGAALGLSAAQLAREDPELAARWQMLSVFPAPFDAQAAATVWQTEAGEARRGLSELAKQCMLLFDPSAGFYRLHDLMRLVAQSVFSYGGVPADDQAQAARLTVAGFWHAGHYLKLGAAADDMYAQGGERRLEGLRLIDLAWPHLIAAFRRMLARPEELAVGWVCHFPGVVAKLMPLRTTPRERIPLLQASLAAARLLRESGSERTRLSSLGGAYMDLGDAREAVPYFVQALAVARREGSRQGEGNCLHNLSQAYSRLGRMHQAIECCTEALKIHSELGDRTGEGSALVALGGTYRQIGRIREAIECHEEALQIAHETGDRPLQAVVLGNLGAAYFSLEDSQNAIGCYESALAIAQELGDFRRESDDLGGLGLAYAALGQSRQAIRYYQQALEIAKRIGSRGAEENHLGNLGAEYAKLGEIEKAVAYVAEALEIAREIGDSRGEANCLGNLASTYRLQGNYEEAIQYYQRASAISRDISDPYGQWADRVNLAMTFESLGERRRALGYDEEALEIAREIGNRRGEGRSLLSLGQSHEALGEVREAIACYERALVIALEHGDQTNEAICLGNIGVAYLELGELLQAIDYCKQALEVAEDTGDRSNVGVWLGCLGSAHAALGEVQKAIEHHEQALVISLEIGDRQGEGYHLGNLGSAHMQTGRVREAVGYFEQALAITREIGDHRGEGTLLGNLGLAYVSLGEVREAITYHEQSLDMARETGDRRSEGVRLGNLGLAYADLGEVQKAIEHYEQALAIAREAGDRRSVANHLGNLGSACASLGEVQKAIKHYEEALAIAREIGDRRGEAYHSWNLGVRLEESDPTRAAELMQVCVDYERQIGHPDAEGDAERLCQVRARIKQ